ncbi:MAG TPA: heme utilization protein, partial [Pseudorhodoferax sp.]|nr:heme utilization protein [Pseudorhodoferax sp.]
LTTAQIAALETGDLAALRTTQIAALSTTAIAALTTAQIEALTTAQVASLSTRSIAALTTAQVAALETRDLVVLSTTQIRALETSDLLALSTAQVKAFTTTQVHALTTTQIGAFTTTQIQHLALGSPVILDLDGNGVQTQSITAGVKFDLFADGNAVQTGWVSRGDGLLVLDRNGDGTINDGSELFGTSTRLANGETAADGYAALRELDSNGDGVLNADDAAFADLRLWVDADSDGVSQSGELRRLSDYNIASINLNARAELSKDNGNLVGLVSSYETTDGATHAAADVWFVAQRATAETAQAGDLRTQVGSLAEAIGSFDSDEAWNTAPQAAADPATAAAARSATQGVVVGMADAMRQFDANGNPVAGTPSTAVVTALGKSMTQLAGLQDPAQQGILAGGTLKA